MRRSRRPRRGIILLVVITMLTLFAAIGLAFVLTSSNEATASRYFRESRNVRLAVHSPDGLFDAVLSSLIYDVPDDRNGVRNSLRGHSLARLMYGADDGVAVNDLAYAGEGLTAGLTAIIPHTAPLDDALLVNYTWFPNDGFLRDPERIQPGPRGSFTSQRFGLDPFALPRGSYHPKNASYTYPDVNNLALAVIDRDGRVILPSFHRPWLFTHQPEQPAAPLTQSFADPTHPHWHSAVGKYLTLRPRPAEHSPSFPYPAETNGDVKNLLGAPGGNDSFWLDVNLPVYKMRDGRHYKPLAALLVADLSGRVNVNTAGNLLNADGRSHSSNQGWGAWEVNLEPLVRAASDRDNPADLFFGRADVSGRSLFAQTEARRDIPAGPFYARTDADGSSRGSVYTPPQPRPFDAFPAFPATFGNASPTEQLNHPLSGASSWRFGPEEMGNLLFHRSGGDLATIWPNALDPQRDTLRQSITTVLSDVDAPGIVARPDNQLFAYGFYPGSRTPVGPTSERLPWSSRFASPPHGSEWEVNAWRSRITQLAPLDLTTPLPDYRWDPVGYTQALTARQRFARAIWDRLRMTTVARDAETLRWLAQLAVNIVDSIDRDDVITAWVWNPLDPQRPDGPENYADDAISERVVFGTELPRLVVNEAYAERANDPDDPGIMNSTEPNSRRALRDYRLNVWVELHNPLRPARADDAPLTDAGAARLHSTHPIYQLFITAADPSLLDANNRTGEPHPDAIRMAIPAFDGTPSAALANAGDAKALVLPGGGRFSGPEGGNAGFFVIGPPTPLPDHPAPAASMTFPALSMPISNRTDLATPEAAPTIVLRRLLCPALPPNETPGPGYNPYITVDFIENVPVQDAIRYTPDGERPRAPEGRPGYLPMERRAAVGRKQPYGAAFLMPQAPENRTDPARYQERLRHTFFRQNSRDDSGQSISGDTLEPIFDAPMFLDRTPISPVELFGVSAVAPHLLTQRFIIGANAHLRGTIHAHTANWQDRYLPTGISTRLHRALALFHCGDLQEGRINLNAVWSPEVMLALCDPQEGNGFTHSEALASYRALLAQRTPLGVPGPQDRPLLGVGAGFDARATLLNAALTDFQPGQAPFQQRIEMLNKIYNRVTTRGNVFAVWCTIGFFEVVDYDADGRPRLGAELKDQAFARQRYFAIIDRANLSMDPLMPIRQGPRPFTLRAPFGTQAGQPTYLALPSPDAPGGPLTGRTRGQPWRFIDVRGQELNHIPPEGSAPILLVIDQGTQREIVTAVSVIDPNQPNVPCVRFTTQSDHAPGCRISNAIPGNPGPQPNFSRMNPMYQSVVTYSTIPN